VAIQFVGCTNKNWDDHYLTPPPTINTNVWDAIKSNSELSGFVTLMEKYNYDSLFMTDNTYTLFIPDNSAIAKMAPSQVSDTTILNYLISRHYIQPMDIKGKRKLQTLAKKFSTFESGNGQPTYDGIPLAFESPLYVNGKYFIMGEVALPKLNLYEYFAVNTPYLKAYIDSKDSITVDQAKSTPIGFNDKGQTVYDTVAIKYNSFETKVFPVSTEWRNYTSTFVFPRKANYENGLTAMAQKLGGRFIDYKDIPIKWQNQILIPYLIKQGTFLNMLDVNEFRDKSVLTYKKKYTMMNISGDSIIVDYKPSDPYLCSNGLFYEYANFVVPEKLYSDTIKMQGEALVRPQGVKFVFKDIKDSIIVKNPGGFSPNREYIKGASNDSIMVVNFTKGYKGIFDVDFQSTNLFPRKYRLEVLTKMDIGGIYDIYVNGVLLKRTPTSVNSFDYAEFTKVRGGLIKSVTGATLVPRGQFNKFDFYVDNIIDYGKPKVRFEYKGPGTVANNGLVIDALYFIPVAN
jgi:hypothetical protein